MIILYNPTNEEFPMQHAGISMTIKPDEKMEVQDACARHVLNAFGQRGLTQLTYGCNEEKVKKEAIARNLGFKKKQIVEYNQRNENRKMMGLNYLPPTTTMTEYAIELGLKLLEPFSMKDMERQNIIKAKEENDELREEMAELKRMMAHQSKVMSTLIQKSSIKEK